MKTEAAKTASFFLRKRKKVMLIIALLLIFGNQVKIPEKLRY